MSFHHKVTFFDLEHRMNRSVEIEGFAPEAAAEVALKKLMQRDLFVSDFDEAVIVETITRSRQTLPLKEVASKLTSKPQVA